LNLAGEVCDRLMLLAGGRAAATGSPEVVLEESLLSSVFGCDVVVDKGEPGRRPLVRLTWRA
jgi:iron complex transport system ATP-binding protein